MVSFTLIAHVIHDYEEVSEFPGDDDLYTILINNDIQPEIEISFQAEEEPMCMVYTDRSGNIRCMILDRD